MSVTRSWMGDVLRLRVFGFQRNRFRFTPYGWFFHPPFFLDIAVSKIVARPEVCLVGTELIKIRC